MKSEENFVVITYYKEGYLNISSISRTFMWLPQNESVQSCSELILLCFLTTFESWKYYHSLLFVQLDFFYKNFSFSRHNKQICENENHRTNLIRTLKRNCYFTRVSMNKTSKVSSVNCSSYSFRFWGKRDFFRVQIIIKVLIAFNLQWKL